MPHDALTYNIPVPALTRLATIQAHLRTGGQVMVQTSPKATIYTRHHLAWFTATEDDLFVKRGKGKACLNSTLVRFSLP